MLRFIVFFLALSCFGQGNNLIHWRTALGKVKAQTANARVLIIGDSTTYGFGSTSPFYFSWPSFLSLYFQDNQSTPSMVNFVMQNQSNNNSQISLGTNWVNQGSFGIYSNSIGCPVGLACSNLIITPGVLANNYYVYYVVFPNNGNFTATASGGASVGPISAAGTAAINKVLVSASTSSASNTITISASGGTAGLYIVGVEAQNTAKYNILISNWGYSASYAQQWDINNGGSANINSLSSIAAYSPDLTIISLGINDCLVPYAITDTTLHIANIASTALRSGDVILMSTVPSSPILASVSQFSCEATLSSSLQSLASNLNVPFYNVFNRFSSYNSFLYYDALHPNNSGYADWAQNFYQFLINQ